MTRRPKFWLHRSHRFWLGLAMMIFLTAFWWSFCFFRYKLSYIIQTPLHRQQYWITLEQGRCMYRDDLYDVRSSRLLPHARNWMSEFDRRPGAMLGFEWEITDSFYIFGVSKTRTFGIPLWIPPLIWAVLWPLWMRRADRREARLFDIPS